MDYPMLALLTIAAARVVHLVTDDDIPFGGLRTWALRRFPKYGWGLGCTFCMSIWAGAASAGLATGEGWIPVDGLADWPVFAVVWFAIAQLIILLEALVGALMGSDD